MHICYLLFYVFSYRVRAHIKSAKLTIMLNINKLNNHCFVIKSKGWTSAKTCYLYSISRTFATKDNPLSQGSTLYNVLPVGSKINCQANSLGAEYFSYFIRTLGVVFKLALPTIENFFILYTFFYLFPMFLTSSFYDHCVKSLERVLLPEFLLAFILKISPKVRSSNSGSAYTEGRVITKLTVVGYLLSVRTFVKEDKMLEYITEISMYGKFASFWNQNVKTGLLRIIDSWLEKVNGEKPTHTADEFLVEILRGLPTVFHAGSCKFVTHEFSYPNSLTGPIGIYRFRNYLHYGFQESRLTYCLPQVSTKGLDKTTFELFCVFLFLTHPIYLDETDGSILPMSCLAGEGVVDLSHTLPESAFEFLFNLKIRHSPGGDNLDPNNGGRHGNRDQNQGDIPGNLGANGRNNTILNTDRKTVFKIFVNYKSFVFKPLDYRFVHKPIGVHVKEIFT